jgi:ATP adenylyltransferase
VKKSSSKLFNPFETPQKGLFITDLGSSHYLVLNKFPVIPDHFILATTKFKEQTDLLEEEDIAATYECIKGYREAGEELFGFFNSGEHSGASQRHRHIQFLPVQSMRSGMEEGFNYLTNKAYPSNILHLQYRRLRVLANSTTCISQCTIKLVD